MKTARIIAVWLLMLALPLQGVAAISVAVDCVDGNSGQAAQVVPGHHQNHHGAASQAHEHPANSGQHDDGQPVEHASVHSCCNHVFTGVPSVAVPGTPAPPNTVLQRVTLLATLHIPEQPQRPPRA